MQTPLQGWLMFKSDGVSEFFANGLGTFHGGAMMTFVDVVTTMALFTFDQSNRLRTVSVSMSADYISSGPINKPYYFKAKVIKIGK